MTAKRFLPFYLFTFLLFLFSGCFGGKLASSGGGEVTGAGGRAFSEPTPYGMTLIKRGHLKMGMETNDSLWGRKTPLRDISVDGFWMDETEVTNSKYRQFVNYVRDSILRERLAEVDETYRTMKTDKEGNELGSVLNWKKPLPRKPSEEEQEIIDGIYATNPVTGEKMLDCRQMNYRYEVYDYTSAALRRNRLDPEERNLNTDIAVNPNEVVWISKDTAYIDDEGKIVRETINRQLSGPWDFLNTYIVNIYPDTTCWVNDFPNADNEMYMRYYFSNPAYNEYPVVGVTWEQANAFCHWRTEYLLKGLGAAARFVQRYRLPTEAEWEFAARGGNNSRGYKYAGSNTVGDVAWYGNNSNGESHNVAEKNPNELGLYDMSGNVEECCQDWYDQYNSRSQTDPTGPSTGSLRVNRGGGWYSNAGSCRISNRSFNSQGAKDKQLGLRLAL